MKAFSIASSQAGANYTSCSLLTKNSSLQICGKIPQCSSPFRYTSAPFLKGDRKRGDDDSEASCLGWASPHLGFGPQIELSSRDARGLFNLGGIGKTLSWKPHHAGRGATSLPGD